MTSKKVQCKGTRYDIKGIAHAYLYIFHNDLHKEPCGYLEDLYVEPEARGKGLGTKLINTILRDAKKQGCYKLSLTCQTDRKKVHKMYLKAGMKVSGLEFKKYY